jgi:hypothetical protein
MNLNFAYEVLFLLYCMSVIQCGIFPIYLYDSSIIDIFGGPQKKALQWGGGGAVVHTSGNNGIDSKNWL